MKELRITILGTIAISLPMLLLFFCVHRGVEYDKKIKEIKRYEIRLIASDGRCFSEDLDIVVNEK